MHNNFARLIIGAGFALLLGGVAYFTLANRNSGQDAIFVEMLTLDTAFEKAEAEDKPVLMLALATWCPYCQELDKRVLQDEDVQEAIAEHAIPTRYNITVKELDPEAWRELRTLNIRSVPTLIMLDKNGREISRLAGLVEPEAFAQWVRSGGATMPETGKFGTVRTRGS